LFEAKRVDKASRFSYSYNSSLSFAFPAYPRFMILYFWNHDLEREVFLKWSTPGPVRWSKGSKAFVICYTLEPTQAMHGWELKFEDAGKS